MRDMETLKRYLVYPVHYLTDINMCSSCYKDSLGLLVIIRPAKICSKYNIHVIYYINR